MGHDPLFRRVLYAAAYGMLLTLVPNCYAGSKLLYNLNSSIGTMSTNPLYRDAAGNLYGMTHDSGPDNAGTIFELLPQPSGRWRSTVLHTFTNEGNDYGPVGGLAPDAAGNLYGALNEGGGGAGQVFQLAPQPGGRWKYSVIYTFKLTGGDVLDPFTTPTIDSTGNIYGAAYLGGDSRNGGVYKISPQPDGSWQESVIYSFEPTQSQATPLSLIFGPDGNLYGTLEYGGIDGIGSVYQLTPSPDGSWTAKTIFSMSPKEGGFPRYAVGLSFDSAGNIVGTTSRAMYELPHNNDGTWGPVVIIRHFKPDSDWGSGLVGNPILDSANNIYGTTMYGGPYNGGVAYKLSPDGKGGWIGVLLHGFGSGTEGIKPWAEPILDSSGNLYGTTFGGGANGGGTVWEITPKS